jgi:hypothetical protein
MLCTTSNSRTLGIRFRTATIRQSWHQTPARGYHASGAAGSKARKSPYADAGRWTQNTRMGRRLAWSFTADTARPNPGEPRRSGSPGPICVFCVHLPASAQKLFLAYCALFRTVPSGCVWRDYSIGEKSWILAGACHLALDPVASMTGKSPSVDHSLCGQG